MGKKEERRKNECSFEDFLCNVTQAADSESVGADSSSSAPALETLGLCVARAREVVFKRGAGSVLESESRLNISSICRQVFLEEVTFQGGHGVFFDPVRLDFHVKII